jgi:hypothetical protein
MKSLDIALARCERFSTSLGGRRADSFFPSYLASNSQLSPFSLFSRTFLYTSSSSHRYCAVVLLTPRPCESPRLSSRAVPGDPQFQSAAIPSISVVVGPSRVFGPPVSSNNPFVHFPTLAGVCIHSLAAHLFTAPLLRKASTEPFQALVLHDIVVYDQLSPIAFVQIHSENILPSRFACPRKTLVSGLPVASLIPFS